MSSRRDLVRAAALASLSDPTPEGSSVVELAEQQGFVHDGELARRGRAVHGADPDERRRLRRRQPGPQGRRVERHRLGAGVGADRPVDPQTTSTRRCDAHLRAGGTPLAVATKSANGAATILGVIYLKDIVKTGLAERFADMRRMGIRTVMITGDNPITAQAIATEAGVDDFLAEATPEDKLALIRKEQEGGNLVAMTGDGTNDAPALAQADVGVAMNTGTSAAKEAGNMVDLDSDPTKLIDIVSIGKQLLITRGALTTFSIANDVAKYFAIIPAMFVGVFPGLAGAQHHAAALAVVGHPVRGHLQRAHHRRS